MGYRFDSQPRINNVLQKLRFRWKLLENATDFEIKRQDKLHRMATKGDNPSDFRSEAERIRPRAAGALFKQDPEAIPGVRAQLRYGVVSELPFSKSLSPNRKLLRRVIDRISATPELSTAEITIEIREETVILTGTVDTINSKYSAENAVKRLDGVSHVENHLTIRLGEALEEFTRGPDASRLREEFARNPKGFSST
jgi:hypothetical protein